MIDTDLRVTLHGTPVGKGSMRCIGGRGEKGHQLIPDNSKAAKAWAERLAQAFKATRRKYPEQAADRGQPITVEVTLTLERPSYHYGTGRNAGKLKPAHVDAYPVARATSTTGGGDVDKLARLVVDEAQTAGILLDDAQVAALIARKTFTAHRLVPDALDYPGAVVRFSPYRGE